MGRRAQLQGSAERLHLQRVSLGSQGYDTGGAYWGWGERLWCAFSPDSTNNEEPVRVFVRAGSRKEAKQRILEILSAGDWCFFK
jgi:hypothetical protein